VAKHILVRDNTLQFLEAHLNTVLEAALVPLAQQEAALVALELQELVTAAAAEAHQPQVMVAQEALVLRLEEAAEVAALVAQDQHRVQAEQAAQAA